MGLRVIEEKNRHIERESFSSGANRCFYQAMGFIWEISIGRWWLQSPMQETDCLRSWETGVGCQESCTTCCTTKGIVLVSTTTLLFSLPSGAIFLRNGVGSASLGHSVCGWLGTRFVARHFDTKGCCTSWCLGACDCSASLGYSGAF